MTTLNLNNFVTTEETRFVRLKALHIVTQGDLCVPEKVACAWAS